MEVLKSYVIQKDLQITPAENGEEIFNIIISSGRVDAVGDVMNINGVDLSSFEVLEGVYYNHDTSKPAIAECRGIEKIGDYLVAKTYFHELTVDSKEKKDLVKNRIIRCASIQFSPIEWHEEQLTEEERIAAGLPKWLTTKTVYDRWKLLEYSIVNIPANIDAQIQLRKSLTKSNGDAKMPVTKAGAALSKSNKDKLNQVISLINEVIGSEEAAAADGAAAGGAQKSADVEELKAKIEAQSSKLEEILKSLEKPEPEIEKEDKPEIISFKDYQKKLESETING